MIIIIGTPEQEHPAYVYQKIMDMGGKAHYFEPWRFPAQSSFCYDTETPTRGFLQPSISAPRISFSDITGVYSRYILDFISREHIPTQNKELLETYYNEMKSGLGSLFRNTECLWADSIEASEQHLYKAHQYKTLKAKGVRVPDTIVTNDPESMYAFYEKHDKEIVCKPCWFGAYTKKIVEEDFTPERLGKLREMPVTFQEFIPGTDVLVYMVKDKIFAADVLSKNVDFRSSELVQYVNITLPDAVAQMCITAARTVGVNFPVIDMRRTPAGEYVFFEANPSPIFIHFEQATGYPIGEHLVKLLMSGEKRN